MAPRLTALERQEINRLYIAGWTYPKIAAALGRSYNSISRHLIDADLVSDTDPAPRIASPCRVSGPRDEIEHDICRDRRAIAAVHGLDAVHPYCQTCEHLTGGKQ